LAEIGISGCTLSDKSLDSSSSLIITHLDSSINKAHIEFSPIAINDSTFIYASLKLDSSQFFANEDIEKIPVRKFYVGEKRGDKWKYKSPLAGPFNEPGVNTGNGAFCPDKKHFYFTKCNKEGNSKVNCAIYMSINKGGHWSTPEKLDDAVNLSPYTSTQPAVGTESKGKKEILYFVSDRPEGLGGLDLWYSVYNPRDKTFKKPKNLGNGINTNGDEYTPFYEEETRTLYFSTDGWPGIGGLDIFKSNGELTQWTQAQNIGKPINSSYDDLYYTLDEERKTGFFTSNRPGGVALENATCCDDIYSFERKHITAVVVAGKIKLENSAESLENVSVSLTLLVGKQRPILLHTDSITANGDYSFKVESGNDYSLTIRKPGYFTHQIRFSTKVPIKADTIIVETATIKAIPLEQGIVMPNIHYATNKFELSDANKMALDTTLLVVLIDNPDFKVEIGAHTDNQGNDGANQILSQRRAEGLVKYLISKGVSPRRLTATGYGETMPIAPNQTPDGIDDPIAMQKNRRTEFKIIANKF
jgi:outer membrane protein OmpA-like peptidoglycan-associated protein